MSLFHHLFLPHHSNNQRARILHPSFLSLFIAVFALWQFGLTFLSARFPQILGYASQISPAEIVRLTNERRAQTGAPAVKLDTQLSAAAAQKAADMFAKNYWAHVSPSGTQPWFFITSAGYSYRFAGENLARDFSDPASVVAAWMNSPTHKDNLLNSRYQDIGVAVVDGTLDGRETTLVVQMFGARLAAAPQISQTSQALSVKAQETTFQPTPFPTPVPSPIITQVTAVAPAVVTPITPFDLTKYVSVGLLGLLVIVLIIDILIVKKRGLIRWTSKSFAHLIFIVIILLIALTLIRGRII